MSKLIFALLVAWILSLFGFDKLIINGFEEVFHIVITTTGYYFLAVVVGLVFKILDRLRGDN